MIAPLILLLFLYVNINGNAYYEAYHATDDGTATVLDGASSYGYAKYAIAQTPRYAPVLLDIDVSSVSGGYFVMVYDGQHWDSTGPYYDDTQVEPQSAYFGVSVDANCSVRVAHTTVTYAEQ